MISDASKTISVSSLLANDPSIICAEEVSISFSSAVHSGNFDLVRALITRGIEPSTINPILRIVQEPETPETLEMIKFLISLSKGNQDLTTWLFGFRNKWNQDAFAQACQSGNSNIAGLLLEANIAVVDYICADDYKQTELLLATKSGNLSLIQVLIGHGAKIDVLDVSGRGLIHYASSNSGLFPDVFRYIAGLRKWNMNEPDTQGLTPLMLVLRGTKNPENSSMNFSKVSLRLALKNGGDPYFLREMPGGKPAVSSIDLVTSSKVMSNKMRQDLLEILTKPTPTPKTNMAKSTPPETPAVAPAIIPKKNPRNSRANPKYSKNSPRSKNDSSQESSPEQNLSIST